MAVTSLPLISQLTIREAVDAGSYARGKEYHRLGRVKRLEWRPEQRRLVAAVRGSRTEPYATSVWLAEEVSGSEVARPPAAARSVVTASTWWRACWRTTSE